MDLSAVCATISSIDKEIEQSMSDLLPFANEIEVTVDDSEAKKALADIIKMFQEG